MDAAVLMTVRQCSLSAASRPLPKAPSWSPLPFGGHARLAEIPKESSSDSDGPELRYDGSAASSPASADPRADDASVSSGCPEMRYDRTLGPGFFTREDFLDFYGDADGASLWARHLR